MSDNFSPDKTDQHGKLLVKPTAYLRKKPFVKELINHRTGYLTDHSGRHKVRIDWKLNDVAQRDKIFKLTIDDKEVYLDLEELTFYTRVMFN